MIIHHISDTSKQSLFDQNIYEQFFIAQGGIGVFEKIIIIKQVIKRGFHFRCLCRPKSVT